MLMESERDVETEKCQSRHEHEEYFQHDALRFQSSSRVKFRG